MEVGDDEVSIVNMYIDAKRGKKEPGQPADGKQPYEAEGIKHRRGVRDRTLVESRRPIEDFDGRWHANEKSQKRKHQRGIKGDTGHEHVMGPHQESQDSNGNAR